MVNGINDASTFLPSDALISFGILGLIRITQVEALIAKMNHVNLNAPATIDAF